MTDRYIVIKVTKENQDELKKDYPELAASLGSTWSSVLYVVYNKTIGHCIICPRLNNVKHIIHAKTVEEFNALITLEQI